jgi:hypothetical protein
MSRGAAPSLVSQLSATLVRRAYIGAAYWFTNATSFANLAAMIAKAFTVGVSHGAGFSTRTARFSARTWARSGLR